MMFVIIIIIITIIIIILSPEGAQGAPHGALVALLAEDALVGTGFMGTRI